MTWGDGLLNALFVPSFVFAFTVQYHSNYEQCPMGLLKSQVFRMRPTCAVNVV